MYLPTHFKHDQLDDLVELIQQYPLATVVMTAADGTLEVNHLPLEYEMQQGGFGVLRGHIAKANPMFEILNQSAHVYVIFQAEDAYISPNWYEGKQEHHRVVPTWNYRVVHVKGEILKLDDDKYLRGVLARLTRMHEANQPMPWKMGDAPNDFIAEQLEKIVAIEIDIQSMIGKFKVSQNRSAVDVINVAKALERSNAEMAESIKKFYPMK
ncbi:FMN-binding negative transcriptional regulator [Acinetobacter gandensis]|uniref:Transcriptional regulator n=1 Tax=Acinetobacter gandensis TaxID=1443941 RepID=A0A1A7R530_9GAMM|nr:FMN-binding negative transcriptional regulator [Acinetobacter gandensis]KAB0625331.1 FMN-binding negative transcriptional regulator [Acinetobacter gandensis]OBX27365.1 transcriptional regulator [Acinetobacter gandensis]